MSNAGHHLHAQRPSDDVACLVDRAPEGDGKKGQEHVKDPGPRAAREFSQGPAKVEAAGQGEAAAHFLEDDRGDDREDQDIDQGVTETGPGQGARGHRARPDERGRDQKSRPE